MLITELITIYTDKDDYNHIEHYEKGIVTAYSWDDLNGVGVTEKMNKEIAESQWHIEDDWKKYDGDLNYGKDLWVMPKDMLDEYPCEKVIVGVTGRLWGISEPHQKQYTELITVEYTNAMDRKPIEWGAFYLRTVLGESWYSLNGLSDSGERRKMKEIETSEMSNEELASLHAELVEAKREIEGKLNPIKVALLRRMDETGGDALPVEGFNVSRKMTWQYDPKSLMASLYGEDRLISDEELAKLIKQIPAMMKVDGMTARSLVNKYGLGSKVHEAIERNRDGKSVILKVERSDQ